jgi:hypothetical protein
MYLEVVQQNDMISMLASLRYQPTFHVIWMRKTMKQYSVMRYMFLLQNQKLAPHQTQSHVGESWHGGPALSRRISWRFCRRCGPRAVGLGSALGLPTLPRPVLATRLQALMRLMAPRRRILCETWIYTWNRCIVSELLGMLQWCLSTFQAQVTILDLSLRGICCFHLQWSTTVRTSNLKHSTCTQVWTN